MFFLQSFIDKLTTVRKPRDEMPDGILSGIKATGFLSPDSPIVIENRDTAVPHCLLMNSAFFLVFSLSFPGTSLNLS